MVCFVNEYIGKKNRLSAAVNIDFSLPLYKWLSDTVILSGPMLDLSHLYMHKCTALAPAMCGVLTMSSSVGSGTKIGKTGICCDKKSDIKDWTRTYINV